MEELLSKSRASERLYGGVTLTLFLKDHSGCYVEKTVGNNGLTLLYNFMSEL